MESLNLIQSLDRYDTLLTEVETGIPQPGMHPVLSLLLARDRVQSALGENGVRLEDAASRLLALDARLQKLASVISGLAVLPVWRTSIRPEPENWWWFFELSPVKSARLSWLWDALAAVFLTVGISLAADISSRFLKSTPDTVGTFTLVAQGLLMTATAGGVLTRYGREWLDRVLAGMKVSARYWSLAKAGLSLGILTIILSLHLSMPLIAFHYNNSGLRSAERGHITSALANYKRALALRQDYPEAHYNLGLLFEDLQNIPAAKTEYLSALQGGLDAAYNNLARLRILEGDYSNAVTLLINGLDLTQDVEVRYDLLKNLGWARVHQGRFSEAEAYLQAALELNDQRAPVYCLLGQVYEAQQRLGEAHQAWNDCLAYASIRYPDEDAWIGMARQYMSESKSEQP